MTGSATLTLSAKAAKKLGLKKATLAAGTVKNYVSVIVEKLDTRDRSHAVLKAITLRVIRRDCPLRVI